MIVCETGITNKVVLYLNSTTIDNPYYVFRLIDNDNNEKVFYSENISIDSNKQEFNITISTTEDLTGGTINWFYNEKNRFYVYQSDASGVTNINSSNLKPLNPDNTFDKDRDYIYVGYFYVDVENEINKTVYNKGDNDRKIVYKK